MAVFEESVVLPVGPDRAFAIIGDPENGPKIDPMISRYEPEGGAMREGGLNHIRGRVFGVPIHIVSLTREWDPPRRMVLENIKPARPVRMRLTQTFEPHSWSRRPQDIGAPRLSAAVGRTENDRDGQPEEF